MDATIKQVPAVMDPVIAESIKQKILALRTGTPAKPIAPILKGYSKVKGKK